MIPRALKESAAVAVLNNHVLVAIREPIECPLCHKMCSIFTIRPSGVGCWNYQCVRCDGGE